MDFTNIENEIIQWKKNNKQPQFFLRDDDACEVTPELEQLTQLCEKHSIPLMLAVIPKQASQNLGPYVSKHPLLTPATHGYQHINHNPAGEKKCEFNQYRPIDKVLGELRIGRDKLNKLFSGNLSGTFVPPWNRIHDDVLLHLKEAGFDSLSTYGWKKRISPIPILNTHIDVIDWVGGRIGNKHQWLLEQTVNSLKLARKNNFSPLGLLTHHLDHDDTTWAFLDSFFSAMAEKNLCSWHKAQDLISF